MHPIKMLVAALDDRLPSLLCASIGKDPSIRLLGRFASAAEAIESAERQNPDVIAYDLRLDDMKPEDAIKRLSHAGKSAVVAMSPAMGRALQMIDAGAVDFIYLPVRGSDSDGRLFAVDALSRLKVATLGRVIPPVQQWREQADIRLLAVHAAQGGLVQAACMLKKLDRRCPPVLILQKNPGQYSEYPARLCSMCGWPVKAVSDGMMLEDATIYVAFHCQRLRIDSRHDGLFLQMESRADSHSDVCADDFFHSLVGSLGGTFMGVSLSGDGEGGLRAVVEAGGLAIRHNKNALLSQPGGVGSGGVVEMALDDIAMEIERWRWLPQTSLQFDR